jgi:murein L,D-transpeptidase YcbB/YkuD
MIATIAAIGDWVGVGRTNRAEDVLWLKAALHALGRYPSVRRKSPEMDPTLDDAIRCYQRDHDLRPNGVIDPMSETVRRLTVDLAALEEA